MSACVSLCVSEGQRATYRITSWVPETDSSQVGSRCLYPSHQLTVHILSRWVFGGWLAFGEVMGRGPLWWLPKETKLSCHVYHLLVLWHCRMAFTRGHVGVGAMMFLDSPSLHNCESTNRIHGFLHLGHFLTAESRPDPQWNHLACFKALYQWNPGYRLL